MRGRINRGSYAAPKCGGKNLDGAQECAFCRIIFSKYRLNESSAPNPLNNPHIETADPPAVPPKSKKAVFLDIKFNHFATPALIKLMYITVIAIAGVAIIVVIIDALRDQSTKAGSAFLLYIFVLLGYRIYAEFMIILF
ncbi:MAG: DUF4282 domain-containing protein [Desulfobacterales bacterium]|nr:DUF4282 domain-containing protein [Desulfobacterales bacterium]